MQRKRFSVADDRPAEAGYYTFAQDYAMKSRKSRKQFHDFIFQQIVDGGLIFSHNAFETFMSYAATKGFTDDQILTMAESRMSSAEILATVEAGVSTRKARS